MGPFHLGSNLTLRCVSRGGHPLPILVWTRDGRSLNTSYEVTHTTGSTRTQNFVKLDVVESSRGNGQVTDVTGSAGVTGRYLAKQKLLCHINQSEESSKITINAQLPITSASHYNRIYSIIYYYCFYI